MKNATEIRFHAIPRWFPGSVGGTTLGTTSHVWVRESLDPRTRAAVVAHELVHLAQARRHRFWLLRYLTSRTFRLRAEAEAYAESVRMGVSLSNCARRLASSYWLGIPEGRAANEIGIYLVVPAPVGCGACSHDRDDHGSDGRCQVDNGAVYCRCPGYRRREESDIDPDEAA